MAVTVNNETIAEIPVFDVDLLPSAELCRRNLERVRALVDDALSWRSHPLLPLATRIVDCLSHSWLARQTNPYLEEIRQVARALGRPGAYFLNTVYEWACSTSLAPDPRHDGARMIRVLDWGMSGLGRHVVIARHETRHGDFFNATWPGYAGVVTGMAPGRFSAAINQGPRLPVSGLRWLDAAITPLQFLCARAGVPAAHLLRRAFEEAADFDEAVDLLADDGTAVAAPALFAVAGVEADQCCVIEAWRHQRRIHRLDPAAPAALGIANQWLSKDLPGAARNRSLTTGPRTSPEENNAARRAMICRIQDGDFDGAADLREPVLNSHTVMVVVANARRGEFSVEALDPPPGSLLPRVVARRSLRQPRREAALP